MDDISTMSPYELLRGLMRGDPANFKQGYSAGSAVIAVAENHALSGDELADLRAYANGYERGLKDAREENDNNGEIG